VDSSQKTERLSQIEIFSGLSPDALRMLAQIASEHEHALGSVIFRQGEAGDRLYMILQGKVRISRTAPGMGEEAIALLSPGDVFGEMALLDEGPRSADVVAHERCVLLSLARTNFEDLLFLHKDLAYEILWNVVRTLIRRLRETNDKLTFLSVSGRF
jgi:CRP-like cAMP-binding protein